MAIPPDTYSFHGIYKGQYAPRGDMADLKQAAYFDEDASLWAHGDVFTGQLDAVASMMSDDELLTVVPGNALEARFPSGEKPRLLDRIRCIDADYPGQKFLAENFAAIVLPKIVYVPGEDETMVVDPVFGPREGLSVKSALKLMRNVGTTALSSDSVNNPFSGNFLFII